MCQAAHGRSIRRFEHRDGGPAVQRKAPAVVQDVTVIHVAVGKPDIIMDRSAFDPGISGIADHAVVGRGHHSLVMVADNLQQKIQKGNSAEKLLRVQAASQDGLVRVL